MHDPLMLISLLAVSVFATYAINESLKAAFSMYQDALEHFLKQF